jgi:(2Fe-2S) ferredoxin
MKTIKAIDVDLVMAQNVRKGMFTIDGMVLKVDRQGLQGIDDLIRIEFRSTVYLERPTDGVQVYGRVSEPMADMVVTDLLERGERVGGRAERDPAGSALGRHSVTGR